eukprot:scaffold7958_cov80-Skeletonema_dohrnii-CCMP3373.AAC.4
MVHTDELIIQVLTYLILVGCKHLTPSVVRDHFVRKDGSEIFFTDINYINRHVVTALKRALLSFQRGSRKSKFKTLPSNWRAADYIIRRPGSTTDILLPAFTAAHYQSQFTMASQPNNSRRSNNTRGSGRNSGRSSLLNSPDGSLPTSVASSRLGQRLQGAGGAAGWTMPDIRECGATIQQKGGETVAVDYHLCAEFNQNRMFSIGYPFYFMGGIVPNWPINRVAQDVLVVIEANVSAQGKLVGLQYPATVSNNEELPGIFVSVMEGVQTSEIFADARSRIDADNYVGGNVGTFNTAVDVWENLAEDMNGKIRTLFIEFSNLGQELEPGTLQNPLSLRQDANALTARLLNAGGIVTLENTATREFADNANLFVVSMKGKEWATAETGDATADLIASEGRWDNDGVGDLISGVEGMAVSASDGRRNSNRYNTPPLSTPPPRRRRNRHSDTGTSSVSFSETPRMQPNRGGGRNLDPPPFEARLNSEYPDCEDLRPFEGKDAFWNAIADARVGMRAQSGEMASLLISTDCIQHMRKKPQDFTFAIPGGSERYKQKAFLVKVNQKVDADGPWGDEADAQAAADTQIITVVVWDTSNIQNGPEVYEPAGMKEEDMTDDLQVILVKHDQMFYRVVLANDDGADDDGLDLRVRTNLDDRLDENAPTTPSSRARDAINAVSAAVSGAVSSAYASFATSSSTNANSSSREGEGRRRRQNADSTPVSNNANDGTTNNGTTPRRPKREKRETQHHNVANF